MESKSNHHRNLIHLGCGPNATPSSWRDFDGSWNLRINKLPKPLPSVVRKLAYGINPKMYFWPGHVEYMELTKPFTLATNSADAIYASHVWEHLYFDEALFAISECHRILKPGGILRLAVPNLRFYCEDYLKSDVVTAAAELNQRLLYRSTSRPKSWTKRIYQALTDFHSHKFMYDPAFLSTLLSEHLFADVAEKKYHESAIPEITEVESAGRVSETAGFAVEGVASKYINS